jgi:hypothetical protein
MRTLGPRSISSFLKILLDIAYALLSIGLLLIAILSLFSAYATINPAPFTGWHWSSGRPILAETPRDAAGFLIFAFNIFGLLTIVGWLRKIFATLVAGEPFTRDNARRLRVIGLVLAALEISHYAVWALVLLTHDEAASRLLRPSLDVTGLFGIGVMFVLAEVFEEGARMKKDLDLTI